MLRRKPHVRITMANMGQSRRLRLRCPSCARRATAIDPQKATALDVLNQLIDTKQATPVGGLPTRVGRLFRPFACA